MKLHRIQLPKTVLMGIPEHERTFAIVTGHLLNELNVLNKIFYRCSQYNTNDRVERKAGTVQALCIAKILAGKLALGWEMLGRLYFNSKLSKEYDPLLDPEALTARRELSRYFGRNNVILDIRNRFAFHYDSQHLSQALAAASDKDGWEMFLTEQSGNSLYFFSEVVMGHGLLEHINPNSHQAAMDRLIDDITAVGGLFITFLTGCLTIVSERYLTDDQGNVPMDIVDIKDPPKLDAVKIPFFVLRPGESQTKPRLTCSERVRKLVRTIFHTD